MRLREKKETTENTKDTESIFKACFKGFGDACAFLFSFENVLAKNTKIAEFFCFLFFQL